MRTQQSDHQPGQPGGRSRPAPYPVFPAAAVRLTELIHRARAGDAVASDALFAATYDDLRRLARARLRASRRNTFLDTGSLVHESYLRFVGAGHLDLEDRVHFMRWAGRVMRSATVDIARRRNASRRGGGAAAVPLDSETPAVPTAADEILYVHEALDRMSLLDPRMTHVVEMRYFGGLNEDEIASALGVTTRTVRRDWEKARILLREALGRGARALSAGPGTVARAPRSTVQWRSAPSAQASRRARIGQPGSLPRHDSEIRRNRTSWTRRRGRRVAIAARRKSCRSSSIG